MLSVNFSIQKYYSFLGTLLQSWMTSRFLSFAMLESGTRKTSDYVCVQRIYKECTLYSTSKSTLRLRKI